MASLIDVSVVAGMIMQLVTWPSVLKKSLDKRNAKT